MTALATAISVPTRLAADADLPTLEESLAAIASAKLAYGTGGVARMVGGLTLVAAALPLWRSMSTYHTVATGAVTVFLVLSGIASMVSGAAALALAVTAPTDVVPPGVGSSARGGGGIRHPLGCGHIGIHAGGLGLGGTGPGAVANGRTVARRSRGCGCAGRGYAVHLGRRRHCGAPHQRHRLPDLADIGGGVVGRRAGQAAC